MADPNEPYPWQDKAHLTDVELLIVGDVNIQHREDPPSAFRNVRSMLLDADLRYANLEGLYGDHTQCAIEQKGTWTHSEPRMIEALQAVHFDVVGCANNVNYGHNELLATLAMLDERNIAHCGAGENIDAAHRPAVIERKGVRLGFLQYTGRYYGDYAIASDTQPGVARLDYAVPSDSDHAERDVRLLGSQVDLIFVSHHLRQAGTRAVEPFQRSFAERMIAAGADLVFGHGAHLNQSIEVIGGVPVFHCIGQFAFDWPSIRAAREGLVLRVLVRDKRIMSVSFVPVWRDSENNVYTAGPGTAEGKGQLDEVRRQSRGVGIAVNENDAVVEL